MQKLTNYFSSLLWYMTLGGYISSLALAQQFAKVTKKAKLVKISKNGHLILFLHHKNGQGGGYKLSFI